MRRALVLTASVWLLVQPAHANGRMPGATEFSVGVVDPQHLIARATYGLVQSFDGGASWQWICEQAINVSGESDPPIAQTADGSIVLLPTVGSSLISRDSGCTWEEAPSPLRGSKPIDLTVDRNAASHVLVVTSTIDEIDDKGLVSYANVLFETADNAASWREVGRLRSDFKIETVEIAPSDSRRIYVSGTASASPLIGVIERSDDGGAHWERTTLDLPATSGSLFISAVDPSNPDRLWVRVPAQGDRFGIFPASLLFSRDRGASFVMLGATRMGMLGFALSPDGKQVAYGGPADGLFVGPSDGSGGYQQFPLRVRCLRWNADALYACGTEPQDPFSVGRSVDQGATFEPMYRLRDTCPQACADGTSFAKRCEPAWSGVAQRIAADAASCRLPWPEPEPEPAPTPAADAEAPDAATPDGAARDAGEPVAAHGGGCAVAAVSGRGASLLWLMLLVVARRSRRRALMPLLLLALAAASCGADDDPAPASTGVSGAFAACPPELPAFAPGLRAPGERGRMAATLLDASRLPPRKYENAWTVQLEGADGSELRGLQVSRVETFMPVHGHYGRPPAEFETDAGELRATIHFTMRGPWQVLIGARAEAGEDEITFEVCVEE